MRASRVRLCVIMMLALGASGCNACNPASPTRSAGATREVWVSPNIGSRDFLDLFSHPEAWSNARSKITGLGFSDAHLRDEPCAACGPNTLRNFVTVVAGGAFRWLAARQLKIILNVPAVKSWDCGASTTAVQAGQEMGNVEANGGRVAFLAMDEPLFSALPPNQDFAAGIPTCQYTIAQTAEVVRAYIDRVHAVYPDVHIGLIEPYPYFSAAQIESFVTALTAAGVTLAFFHLDYDQNFLSVDPVPGFLELRTFFDRRGVPFGVIIVGSNGTNNELASNGALVSALRISNILGLRTLAHLTFESWLDYPPARGLQDVRLYPDNLPDNAQTTMMGMVNVVIDNMP